MFFRIHQFLFSLQYHPCFWGTLDVLFYFSSDNLFTSDTCGSTVPHTMALTIAFSDLQLDIQTILSFPLMLWVRKTKSNPLSSPQISQNVANNFDSFPFFLREQLRVRQLSLYCALEGKGWGKGKQRGHKILYYFGCDFFLVGKEVNTWKSFSS